MKNLSALVLALAASTSWAQAAPWSLRAAPYPSTGFQPTSATFTVNGGAPIACTVPIVSGGVQPTCPLASITAFGTYTLVMTATFASGCLNSPNQATCTSGGPASSDPFVFNYSSGLASKPILSVAP